ncbi:MAG: type II toxin-antitoxin system VapC family toxin [Desulfuromonadales bacterium]|nr:type II toxin-antitoxin system VapC family toxin [Desulfuromonadales bacterium]
MKYLIDTNTIISFFKGTGQVADNLLQIPPVDIGIPAIVLYELEVGLEKSKAPAKRRKQLQTLVNLVTVVPFGEEEAECAAKVRTSLEKLGTPIGPIDNLIAGTALANKVTLITHNTSEFRRIKGLKLVDWY